MLQSGKAKKYANSNTLRNVYDNADDIYFQNYIV